MLHTKRRWWCTAGGATWMDFNQSTPGEASPGCLWLLRRAVPPTGMGFGGAHPPPCNSQISNGIMFLKSRGSWPVAAPLLFGDLGPHRSRGALPKHNHSHGPKHTALTSPSGWDISRGEKGPLPALSPNLSKELIFKAIWLQQSQFWFMSWGDSWAPLAQERGRLGWMGSVPGGTSTQTTPGATPPLCPWEIPTWLIFSINQGKQDSHLQLFFLTKSWPQE